MGNQCMSSRDDITFKGRKLVLEIISATGVPKADVRTHCDPYVKVYLASKADEGKALTEKVSTLSKRNTASPIWHAYRELHTHADAEYLIVELWDADRGSADDFLGSTTVPLSQLSQDACEVEIPPSKKKYDNGLTTSVRLRRVPKQERVQKKLFLIRHGESKWNAAQESKNVAGMVAFDHGLNEVGIQQGRGFNQRWKAAQEEEKDSAQLQAFLEAGQVFSSPLTRATQTALLTLHGHPTLSKRPITLFGSIREIKNAGGLDTVGKAVGGEIKVRVEEELKAIVGEQEAAEVMVDLDVYDCASPWWTPMNDKDMKGEIAARFNDFMSTMEFTDFGNDTAIVVGHSLFFRELCRTYLAPEFDEVNPEFAAELRKYKLSNASCLAVEVVFDDNDSAPKIVNAELMWGSSFHK